MKTPTPKEGHMLTYGIIMTWLVGFVMGIITLGAVFVYLDGKDEKRIRNERVNRTSASRGERTPEQIDADEEAAVALVQNELGGAILSYE